MLGLNPLQGCPSFTHSSGAINPLESRRPAASKLGSLVPTWWAPQSRGHCPFNSSPGRSPARLCIARAPACPACARALVPAPRSRPSSRSPGGRRPLAPLLLPPRGAGLLPAARRPGTRRGAGAAPNLPEFYPAPVSRFPESCPFTLCRALWEPCRYEVRAEGEGG